MKATAVKQADPLQTQSSDQTDFPLAQALQLRIEKQLSFKNIAEIIGYSKTATLVNINNAIKLIQSPALKENSELYDTMGLTLKKARAWELLIAAGDPDKRKKATLGNVYYGLGQVENSIRLDQGQSTSNVQILISDLDKLKPRMNAMELIYNERKAIEESVDV